MGRRARPNPRDLIEPEAVRRALEILGNLLDRDQRIEITSDERMFLIELLERVGEGATLKPSRVGKHYRDLDIARDFHTTRGANRAKTVAKRWEFLGIKHGHVATIASRLRATVEREIREIGESGAEVLRRVTEEKRRRLLQQARLGRNNFSLDSRNVATRVRDRSGKSQDGRHDSSQAPLSTPRGVSVARGVSSSRVPADSTRSAPRTERRPAKLRHRA